MGQEIDSGNAPIVVEVDEQIVTPDESGATVTEQPTEVSEGETWQQTEEAAALADIVASEQIQAAAEVAQVQEEQLQTGLMASLTEMIRVEMHQIRESLAVALEAQTVAITRLTNELASPSEHYLETPIKPTTKDRPSAAERARKRREHLTEKRANRKK